MKGFAEMKILFTSLLITSIMAATNNHKEVVFDKNCVKSENVYGQMSNSVVLLVIKTKDGLIGTGSGLLTSDGSIITSTHVVENADSIIADIGGDKQEYAVFKLGDHDSISILHSNNKHSHVGHKVKFKPAKDISVGEIVYTIGYPLGMEKRFSGGYISGVDGKIIYLSLPTYPGMSGSPVFDCEGNVIGFILGHFRAGNTLTLINPYGDLDAIN